MDTIWKRWWPAGVDEPSIELPVRPLAMILKDNARRLPSKPALIFYGRQVTFAELDDASDRFAGWLASRGVRPGDRVAVFLENCPQFAIAYFGALKAGAINVCLNPMHKAIELEHEFQDSGAKVLVTSDQAYPIVASIRDRTPLDAVVVTAYRDYLPAEPTLTVPPSFLEPSRPSPDTDGFLSIVREAPPLGTPRPRRLDDTALIQYTSGTTGVPKGAELTHGNVVANCELQRVFIGVGEDDVPLGVLPWFHITGMECQMNMMAYAGATLVVLGRFDLETVLRAIQQYRCTLTTLIATINVAIVHWPRTKEFDLSSLRACFSGGAPVPAEIARRWEQVTGYTLIEGYGLSETTAPTHVNPPHRPKYGTVGVPLPFVEAKIVSLEDGRTELGVGQSGEIAVRGPMVMKGYWQRPDATAEAIRDGWFLTGDVGRVDEEGYFTIEERKKDMIKASGYSVFPAEVEAIMYRHPAIAEVGVVGVPDPYRGEDVLAFVVAKPDAKGKVTEQEIVDWCRDQMSVYKAPRQVRFVDALPKTASGKVLKRALRDAAAKPPA
ncbi:MAG: AMP-binding protein [Candidatus Rokubacteria bacterium]|nr:AMP-binding protein [Candidatus Rokubacteria bacterium]